MRTSGSLTAATALSAYQQAAIANQRKTNAVTIFFKVATTFLSILNVTVESGVIRVRWWCGALYLDHLVHVKTPVAIGLAQSRASHWTVSTSSPRFIITVKAFIAVNLFAAITLSPLSSTYWSRLKALTFISGNIPGCRGVCSSTGRSAREGKRSFARDPCQHQGGAPSHIKTQICKKLSKVQSSRLQKSKFSYRSHWTSQFVYSSCLSEGMLWCCGYQKHRRLRLP